MQDTDAFPLPYVAEALGPYIRPREEVTRTRHRLQRHLEEQVLGQRGSFTAVDLVKTGIKASAQVPPSITGVRRAYLRALRAHSAAQERYDALKAEVAQLSSSAASGSAASSNEKPISGEAVVQLLRQREKHRKLQVVDHAVAQIDANGKELIGNHPNDIIRSNSGELPTPPSHQPLLSGEGPAVEARILQLKKAVLAAKSDVDAQNQRQDNRPHSTENGSGQSNAEVTGLQAALNELTGWMEQQLAIMGNAESETHTTSPPLRGNGLVASSEWASLEDIGRSYEEYIVARRQLLQTVSSTPTVRGQDTTAESNSPTVPRSPSRKPEHEKAAETVLPYIAGLTSAKHEEQSLLQQTAQLRRQIASSEGETQRLMARLAEESHLVQPGAGSGKAWAEAAGDASSATTTFVRGRTEVGEAACEDAERALESIDRVPAMFDSLTEAMAR
ncbi:hypothetical protein BAUCODRAFT_519887 [Baudoinia panamericana UAMH 10762]|uniref:Uncharacterized protein n=1 Tax=Baudoinia panamericana (strain UAMH 10762) TaxID=717646 RepID=M2N793_BAUPA|nr:uncharacterized protein BAUCODRAFT_519887 [Baudoinia panamericana UAMH 10762]EMC94944.1 hypothetical protein BAUCODRAFT_519887 [Baudoinia panamericana UAMH 10762]